jgi:hypothetical protein
MGRNATHVRPDTNGLKTPREVEAIDGKAFAMWHPQWGGYGAPCVVEFDARTPQPGALPRPGPGCFSVTVWHDGDFPIGESGERHDGAPFGSEHFVERPTGPGSTTIELEETVGPVVLHYCNAFQIVRFGLAVLELQAEHQSQYDGQPVRLDRDALVSLRARIDALLERA